MVIKIEELVKDLKYDGSWGNVGGPSLIMTDVNVNSCLLRFDIRKDYSCDVKYDIAEARQMVAAGSLTTYMVDDCVGIYSLSIEEMRKFVGTIALYAASVCFEREFACEDIRVEVRGEKHHCGKGVNHIYYRYQDEDGDIIEFPVDIIYSRGVLKNGEVVWNGDYLRKKYFELVRIMDAADPDAGFLDSVSDSLMNMLDIKKGDKTNLCECLTYEAVDENTVLMELDGNLPAEHLLRFRGFNTGATLFKIYEKNNNGTMTYVRKAWQDYNTIIWGTSTSTASQYYFDMRDELMKCAQIKLLMF